MLGRFGIALAAMIRMRIASRLALDEAGACVKRVGAFCASRMMGLRSGVKTTDTARSDNFLGCHFQPPYFSISPFSN